jgi:hypothetical protein
VFAREDLELKLYVIAAMKGLWHVPTTAIHPGISAFVVDLFAFVIITYFTTFAVVKTSKHWSEATILQSGLVCLSMYELFHNTLINNV